MAFLDNYRSEIYSLTRIALGLMFWSNGARKLLGWFGGDAPVELMSMMGAAGLIEFVAGLMILLGFKTRIAAFIASGEMFFAYLLGHVMGDEGMVWGWWANRGERAAMYAWIFLLLASMGSGKWSLDDMLGGGGDE